MSSQQGYRSLHNSYGQILFGGSTFPSFLYKRNLGRSTQFTPGGTLITNKPAEIWNKYTPGAGVGGSSVATRRAKMRLATPPQPLFRPLDTPANTATPATPATPATQILLYHYEGESKYIFNYNTNTRIYALYNSVTKSYIYNDLHYLQSDVLVFKYSSPSLKMTNTYNYINMANKIDCTSSSPNGDIYSLAMWFKTNNTTENNPNTRVELVRFSTGNNANVDDDGYTTQISINAAGRQIIENTIDTERTFRVPVSNTTPNGNIFRNNNWHHIAWCGFGNSTTRTIYMDGVLWGKGDDGTKMPPYTYNATGITSTIGGGRYNSVLRSDSIKGYLDDIQIYTGTLTASQVNTIYNGGTV